MLLGPSGVTAMTHSPYSEAWRQYRRQSLAFIAWAILGLPAMVGASRLVEQALSAEPLLSPGQLGALFIVSLVVLSWHGHRFLCPRCGQRFFRSTLMYDACDTCQHCGLPLYAGK